ncbi:MULTISPECIES: hypothetical protein [Aminobacter]|jgi:hypothetical protein|uniref:Uncharacterized protein n=1 Tax=Aminobacter aminovorans TaxID=83263 RepID=A0AAC9AR78_AMIAI|nr:MULTISPECIES: hypothetical protein [Aminobacter]AMS41294.1 hypothetical protein AA2016_2368 [Aminobacter aminovorans]MBB3707861.1 hypothetical protein [Aminobacter aminovorans]MRX32931.1 hypothetical protein [Aminobacter sp. MDW-2]QNH36572.1 hypothetical protein H5P29_12135 [Aminobacter sp. MDW-2]
MTPTDDPAVRYFDAIAAALSGLEIFMRDDRSPLYRHGIVAKVAAAYISRLERSFACWRNRLGFMETFKISRAESGFPVFQNVLELENDRKTAAQRLASIPSPGELREEMADFILRHKEFPEALQRSMAERLYLEDVKDGSTFSPFILAQTAKVSVNPKSMRPYYLVHWGSFDGTANLPLIYMATVEDSSEAMVEQLVDTDSGRLNERIEIPLPVDGLLNPDLAHRFDDFTEKNSAYSLSPLTVATNLDKDFPVLHPKQLRRMVLGPFYSAGITEHNSTVSEVLAKVRKAENAWLLTWTIQEVYSKAEKPGRKGLWSSEPSSEEFFINTDDLEAARQGVSSYEKHALIPHEAYQALYAAGEAEKIFGGYKVHILSKGQVISDV